MDRFIQDFNCVIILWGNGGGCGGREGEGGGNGGEIKVHLLCKKVLVPVTWFKTDWVDGACTIQ